MEMAEVTRCDTRKLVGAACRRLEMETVSARKQRLWMREMVVAAAAFRAAKVVTRTTSYREKKLEVANASGHDSEGLVGACVASS
jgi:hypothetical protein